MNLEQGRIGDAPAKERLWRRISAEEDDKRVTRSASSSSSGESLELL
jgi:hypothetical protein